LSRNVNLYMKNILPTILALLFVLTTSQMILGKIHPEHIKQGVYKSYDDTLRTELPEVRITVNRSVAPAESMPFSVSIWERSEAARMQSPASSASQVFGLIPGVYISDRDNYSLGERLSIRGMGWRAAFGVRGIHVLLDGVPLTSPDGQTILEIIDPNMIRSAEIIRGPSAVYWGNGSGGTMFLSTRDSDLSNLRVSVRSFAGSNGLMNFDTSVSTPVAGAQLGLNLSNFSTNGYREHSTATIRRLGLHLRKDVSSRLRLNYVGHIVSAPDIQNPGSLTQGQIELNRKGANPLFITQKAGKSYTHILQGVRAEYQRGLNRFETVLHGTYRQLENPIQPSIINIDRLSGGFRFNWITEFQGVRMVLASDVSVQSDQRKNWVNASGQKGRLTIDQSEFVLSSGLAWIAQYNAGVFGINGGLRADRLYFEVNDKIFSSSADRDASGQRTMTAITPQFGLTYNLSDATLYAGFSSAFESPTTTELANRPDLQRGFNPDLNPERSYGFEAGVRGFLTKTRLRYEIALYHIDVRDRLVPFQTEAGGDRNFFENSGKSRHRGVETMLRWLPARGTELVLSYTLGDFEIQSEEGGLQGKKIPGVPNHRLFVSAEHRIRAVSLTADANYHGEMYANSLNTVKNDAFLTLGLRVSGEIKLANNRADILPFVQVRNLTNAEYNGSVSINAFGGRFFEPAPGRTFMAGVALRI
jgi:iron complex outermembrane recepter protein